MEKHNCLILENGAGLIKAGFSSECDPHIYTNATAKVNKSMQYLISNQLDDFVNSSLLQYNRPCTRGYINNWQCENDKWTHIFGKSELNLDPKQSSLIISEPPFNPDSLKNEYNEVVFEYFEFESAFRKPSYWFSGYEFLHNEIMNSTKADSFTIVDSGFSYSHSIPIIRGECAAEGVY